MKKMLVNLPAAVAAMLLGLGLGFAAASAGDFDTEAVSGQLSVYKSIYVAPAKVALENGGNYRSSTERAVSASDSAEKAADLREELAEALARGFALADGPGQGVLTIEPTLTKLRSSRPTREDYSRNPGLSYESVYSGGAAMRIDFSEQGASLGMIADHYDTFLSDDRLRIGPWDDADRAFSSWARRLPKFIEQH